MNLPEGMTAQNLRVMADWFDIYEAIIEKHILLMADEWTEEETGEALAIVRDGGAQEEIRAWADEIAAIPDE